MPETLTTRHARLLTGGLWTAAPLWYLLCEATTAAWFHGYNYAEFFISDLGVPETGVFDGRTLVSLIPQVMNAGFIGTGLLFFLGLLVIAPQLSRGVARVFFVITGAMYAAGIVFVALVPGGPNSFDNGLIVIHMLGAVGLILGGNTAAAFSARAFKSLDLPQTVRWAGPALGALGFASIVLLACRTAVPDGLSERGSVYAFVLWQLVMGVTLLVRNRNSTV